MSSYYSCCAVVLYPLQPPSALFDLIEKIVIHRLQAQGGTGVRSIVLPSIGLLITVTLHRTRQSSKVAAISLSSVQLDQTIIVSIAVAEVDLRHCYELEPCVYNEKTT